MIKKYRHIFIKPMNCFIKSITSIIKHTPFFDPRRVERNIVFHATPTSLLTTIIYHGTVIITSDSLLEPFINFLNLPIKKKRPESLTHGKLVKMHYVLYLRTLNCFSLFKC